MDKKPNEQEQLEISTAVYRAFALQGSATGNLRALISQEINRLITHDFNLLVTTLYRLDISEKKLTDCLASYPDENAGNLVADLVLERELEKFRSRQQFKNNDPIADDDKW